VNQQSEFNFEKQRPGAGYARWLAGRRMAAVELARRMNLPVGHEVEVWLLGGVRLRGRLRLREELLFVEEEQVRHLELMVDRVGFFYREMESCVRLD
jgi:hypothetical protein